MSIDGGPLRAHESKDLVPVVRSYSDPSVASVRATTALARALDILEPRWTLLLLHELTHSPQRFAELRRGLPGITPAVLSRRLRELQGVGLVVRTQRSEGNGARYGLSAVHLNVTKVLDALTEFGQVL